MSINTKHPLYKTYLKLIKHKNELQAMRSIFKHDAKLEKKIGEINRLLETKFYKFNLYTPKVTFYKSIKNKRDRIYNKSVLKRNLKYEDYDKYQYHYRHRHTAKWEAW